MSDNAPPRVMAERSFSAMEYGSLVKHETTPAVMVSVEFDFGDGQRALDLLTKAYNTVCDQIAQTG